MAHKKLNLPQKICRSCQRSFNWRKKWQTNWDNVVYCSERCRRQRCHSDTGGPDTRGSDTGGPETGGKAK